MPASVVIKGAISPAGNGAERQAQDALLRNPLLAVFANMRDGILLCNDQTQIVFCNHSLSRVLQWTEAVMGRRIDSVIDDPDLLAIIHLVQRTALPQSGSLKVLVGKRRRTFTIDVLPLSLDGLDALQAEQPDNKQDDAPSVPPQHGCVVVFHDMTEAIALEKMRRDFVANVSHELRTPLSAINGYAETLLEGAIHEPVAPEFVQVIYNHTQRLAHLVQDLLDLSKLESMDAPPPMAPVNLSTVVHRVVGLVADNAHKKAITLAVTLPEDLPQVMVNDSNLEQVITNLVDNAIKYSVEGGQVTLSAHPVVLDDQPWVQIDIQDTGVGIESKHLPRLFERFYRVDKARSRDMGGTGLGLSIVKHIIKLHGGDIWVDSQPNVGSVFHFTVKQA
jgi:two-component system phosphate regulon sensor histidine kinase PhoR